MISLSYRKVHRRAHSIQRDHLELFCLKVCLVDLVDFDFMVMSILLSVFFSEKKSSPTTSDPAVDPHAVAAEPLVTP